MGFKQPTVFIVGAGAHVDYGMPTAKQLLDAILSDGLGDRRQSSDRVEKFDLFVDHVARLTSETRKDIVERFKGFLHELKQSRSPSIDAFLEVRPCWKECGLQLMSWYLLKYQQDVMPNQENRGYIPWLFGRLFRRDAGSDPLDRLDWENAYVATFNYDQLFEYQMLEMNCARLGVPCETWRLKHVAPADRFFHVYGDLGVYPSWDMENHCHSHSLEPSMMCRATTRVAVADSRKLATGVTEGHASVDVEGLKRCRERLLSAKRLVFLGFRFDPANIQHLGLTDGEILRSLREKRIYTTGYGMPDHERSRVTDALGLTDDPARITWGGNQEGCAEFLSRVMN